MKYPEALNSKLEVVEKVHKSWNSSIRFDEVVSWILQFDSEDYDLAIRIISNINFLNYADVKSALKIAYSKLIRKAIEKGTTINHRNTIFAGLGENGKSGSMISYNFRVINELSEENFADNEESILSGKIENIVLIDDILSTGRQASKEITELTEKVTPFGVKNIFLLTVCGMKEGLTQIEEETKAYTFSAFEYSAKDTVLDLDSKFYEGLTFEQREKYLKKIEDYGKIAYLKQPYGFGKIGALIAFEFNTPNTSIPLIWSDANSWIPLFKRARRINGIKAYYKQFENSKTQHDQTKVSEPKTLTIYVESKTEEIFFDLLQNKKDFAKELGFDKVEIIALGGSTVSSKLFNQLASQNESSIFIFEKDILRTAAIQKLIDERKSNIIILNPNVFSFFNIKELAKNELDNKAVAEIVYGKEITDLLYFEIETYLLKHSPATGISTRMKSYIEKYLDSNMYDEFINEIKKKLT